MDERDRLQQAVASVLAEPVPPSLNVDAVHRRARRLRRRQRALAGLAAVVVVLLVAGVALSARRDPAVSVTVDQPARTERHTHRFRFVGDASEADRRATIDRIRARYAVLGLQVTTEVVSDGELTVTDALGREQSDRFASALTVVGATSLRGVIEHVVPPGAGGTAPPEPAPGPASGPRSSAPLERCAAPALPQYRPATRKLVGCSALAAEHAVEPGDGPLGVEEVVRADAAGGSIGMRVAPALTDGLTALQAACASRAPACPTGTIALTIDETVAGTTPAPSPTRPQAITPAGTGTIGIDGLFDQQLGEWLQAIVHTGRLLVAVEPSPDPAASTSTSVPNPQPDGPSGPDPAPVTPGAPGAAVTTAPARTPSTMRPAVSTTATSALPPRVAPMPTTSIAPAPSSTTTPSTTAPSPTTTTTATPTSTTSPTP